MQCSLLQCQLPDQKIPSLSQLHPMTLFGLSPISSQAGDKILIQPLIMFMQTCTICFLLHKQDFRLTNLTSTNELFPTIPNCQQSTIGYKKQTQKTLIFHQNSLKILLPFLFQKIPQKKLQNCDNKQNLKLNIVCLFKKLTKALEILHSCCL